MNVLNPLEPQNDPEVLTFQSSEISFVRKNNLLMPKLIADSDEKTKYHFLEFFTTQIRNTNTREAYMRAIHQFCQWCEERGLTLEGVGPIAASAYIEAILAHLQP